ncbi:response regulator [Gordonia sp. CPCC 206044]|uniref:response regulator n=1 Tax=Gordonia sp. CPCC 206044 TaxID=3140793 RepID=UPI003AF3417E
MIRVLIVEDDPVVVQAHREYLRRIGGFEVVAATATVRAALQAVTAQSEAGAAVDLVLLDLGLPDGDGIELASELSSVAAGPDIIAITARRDLSSVRSAMSHGIILYLLKPFSYAGFAEKMRQYLSYRSALEDGGDAVSQRQVDLALAELRSADTRRTAKKGSSPETADAVGRVIRDSEGGLTASEAAAAVGISRVTGWRYLERMADEGTVERLTEYGTAGRPQVRYRWRGR